jgi:2-keto-4-pentenoate hydratase/2-oxohepta-3-ene-1,7-dioic acid hydratase in catechol pathway
VLPLAGAALLAPIPQPPSIRDFMAFESHVVTSMAAIGASVDPVWYQQPVFYFTNPAAVFGPGADVPMAPGTAMWDYELEVAAVIGRGGADLDPATAAEHIAGYTILCDWSARDLQGVEMRVGLGPAKGKDTATSIGPLLVTPDELAPYRSGRGYALAMTASVNGTAYSAGTWADLHWSFGKLLAYASRGTHLVPGDVIGSGTVGTGCILELSRVHGGAAYPWLRPGDEVALTVQALGTLTGRVVEGSPLRPLRS